MNSIVVIGGGGHAKVLIAVLHKTSWMVLGYTDKRDRGALLGEPYLGDDQALPPVLTQNPGCAVAIGVGKINVSPLRAGLLDRAIAMGFNAPVLLSPDAVINEEVELGPGTMVFDSAVVNSGTRSGSACIVNTNSTLEHDCLLGDDVHVAPGAVVCGEVSIGSHTLVGAGATILPGLTVCEDCVVAAGAAVVQDLVNPGVYAGVPAVRLR
jgi:sugar O-acyltransferase (sialic acid O-acetyltransferase NeuD family)